MATVNKEIADLVIAKDGYYDDDPRVTHVIRYNNQYGGVSYAVAYGKDDAARYAPSEFVRDPVVIWEAK